MHFHGLVNTVLRDCYLEHENTTQLFDALRNLFAEYAPELGRELDSLLDATQQLHAEWIALGARLAQEHERNNTHRVQ